MTQFNKKDFTYYGGYLEYTGAYEGQPTWDEVHGKENVHPSRIGLPKELFIGRFKYASSPFTKAKFVKELCKSFTVEEYVNQRKLGKSPLDILKNNNEDWYNEIIQNWKIKRGVA